MNKGFYMYSKDEGLTMLKEEADELVNLAPNAGDACISLDNSSFNMFDDFIFSDSYNDNYCSLLGDDLANGSPVDSLTDSLLLSSPEPQESDSSCELITELSFDGVKSENEADDGNYIPASDDLPVLESAVMWGALPDSVSLARPQPTETQSTSSAPALQRLLVAPPTGPPPQDLITNIYSDPGLISNRTVSWDTGVKRLMKQDEEPNAKRAKRSPSPAKTTPTSSPSSSVLMNLLDMQQSSQQILQQKPSMQANYTMVINEQKNMSNQVNRNVQIPVIKVQNVQNNVAVVNPVVRKTMISNPMSPLTLNVCSPICSLPSSPNTSNYTSPAMSPAQMDRLLSPYSTPQMLSPVGKFSQYGLVNNLMSPNAGLIQGRDPFLNKMQASPNFPIQPVDTLLDSNMSTEMWSSDILQETGDILTALDDVKLV